MIVHTSFKLDASYSSSQNNLIQRFSIFPTRCLLHIMKSDSLVPSVAMETAIVKFNDLAPLIFKASVFLSPMHRSSCTTIQIHRCLSRVDDKLWVANAISKRGHYVTIV